MASDRWAFPRRWRLGEISLFALMVGVSPAATAQTLGPLIQLTNTSIFAHCTADHPSQQPGTLFLNTEVEPSLAINPNDTTNFLFGVQQDRWNNGGSRGLRGGYSFDGGNSFSPTSTPGVTQCQGGPAPRSSDPWVTFSPNGASYMSALAVKESFNPNALAAASGQVVSRSTDGGKTWGPPAKIIVDFKSNVLDDKNAITADPNDSHFVYVVWDRLTQFVPGFGVADESSEVERSGAAIQGGDGTDIARQFRARSRAAAAGNAAPLDPAITLVTGPTYFSRTTDGGNSWEAARIIFNPGSNQQTISNQIVPLAGGRIADFFTQLQDVGSGPPRIGFVVSTNHGASFGKPFYASTETNIPAVTPNQQVAIRSADVLFSVASDIPHNALYLVWEDSRFTGVNEVAFAMSSNGGATWSTPIRINQTPRKPGATLFQQALIPSVATLADGTVVATYYDFRNDAPGASTDNTDFWAISCNPRSSADQCQSNSDWATEARLTKQSFNFDNAPLTTSGVFVGDYMSMRSVGQTVYTVFGQATTPNLTNIYLRSLTIPASAEVASR